MTTTTQVPTGLAFFKGISVFDPSDAFMEELKAKWAIDLSFLDSDERVLWVGSPDFRYSFVGFGPWFAYNCLYQAIFGLYIGYADKNPGINIIYICFFQL